jgi:hypothetical protein
VPKTAPSIGGATYVGAVLSSEKEEEDRSWSPEEAPNLTQSLAEADQHHCPNLISAIRLASERNSAPERSGAAARLERNLSEVVKCARLALLTASEELSMKKSILVGLAILTLSTSAAFAAQQSHHRHAMHASAMNAHAAVPATPAPAPAGVSSADHAQYMKNLHDSGYNPKNNFNTNGTIKTQ